MQRAVTTLALVLVCIAAASVAYYHIKYLPRVRDAELVVQRRKADLENAQRCNKDAAKFSADFRDDMSSELPDPGRDWYDPEMHFSRNLNTCLVEIGFGSRGNTSVSQFVYDVYSNREVMSTFFVFVGGEEKDLLLGIDPKKYRAEKAKLFSE